jgi:hypothetical protein
LAFVLTHVKEKESKMDKNSGKFSEPRGWALKWSFAGEAPPPTADPATGNGNGTWKEFANPRGWALKWDGTALARAGEPRGEHTEAEA